MKNSYLKKFALSRGCPRLPVLNSKLAFCAMGSGLLLHPHGDLEHVQNNLHTRRFTCVSSFVSSQAAVPAA